MGIFGAFATPVGGVLYDRFGATPTFWIGWLMAATGIVGLLIVTQPGLVPPAIAPYLVGLLYFVEEQGSSSLYMGICLDALVHFPAANTSFSLGLIAFGYSLSSVAAAFVVARFEPSIYGFLVFLGVAFTVFSFIRIFVLGDVESSGWENVESKKDSSLGALATKPFFKLAAFALGCLVPCTALIGVLKGLGDSRGIDGNFLAQVALIANCMGRLAIGFSYDQFRVIPSEVALLIAATGLAFGFCMLLTSMSPTLTPLILTWLGVLLVSFMYGGIAPLSGAYVKDHFPSNAAGTAMGLFHLLVAIGNMLWTVYFPVNTPGDWTRSFMTASAVCTVLVLSCITDHFMLNAPNQKEKA
eukprot:CAMPEP_0206571732 /NCGR_PEP_ID=MMETSP0325_2-20121206/27815_1 /ASSEMBLY_ACC=CAM_ASM_000347 /TAXON_ID=2866 /ORGANISM="Crypthecodinium cohnii, Strain Seligo" /LENGTH=355 /DNA_ID=CAMNT_0054075781 /DNA_START=97 /DNA_END=1164 /DNA_ORIENTATION=+